MNEMLIPTCFYIISETMTVDFDNRNKIDKNYKFIFKPKYHNIMNQNQ